MKKRKLGRWGLEVSELGLGCMGMSEFYGRGDQFESEATIDRAIDLGVTFFDTSDIYGPFTNEELVGRALLPHRRKVQIADEVRHCAEERRPNLSRGRQQSGLCTKCMRGKPAPAWSRNHRPLLSAPCRSKDSD